MRIAGQLFDLDEFEFVHEHSPDGGSFSALLVEEAGAYPHVLSGLGDPCGDVVPLIPVFDVGRGGANRTAASFPAVVIDARPKGDARSLSLLDPNAHAQLVFRPRFEQRGIEAPLHAPLVVGVEQFGREPVAHYRTQTDRRIASRTRSRSFFCANS